MECEYSYSAYGTRTVVNGYESVIGYCGRDGVLTENGGLCYMRSRYYSPELMRFVNQDIVVGDISNSNSLNRYTYVEGNPATMVDPFGLCANKSKPIRDVPFAMRMCTLICEEKGLIVFLIRKASRGLGLLLLSPVRFIPGRVHL